MTIALSAEEARHAFAPTASDHLDEDALVERYATVVWSHLVEPGDAVAGLLVAAHGARGALEIAAGEAQSHAVSARQLGEARKRWHPRLDSGAVASSLAAAARSGVTVVTRADAEWPGQLDDLGPHGPHCLWVRGDARLLPRLRPSVAIVGARAATSYGEHVAAELSADLAGGGVPVVSGGAYGIDGVAHRAALAGGGVTAALLAGGVERAYPAGHSALIDRIAVAGIVASEVPCGSAPTKWRFLQRNRLIAALTSATVVVEAGWRSGSLNTAGHAAALGRPVGAVPGPITSATSAGSHRLLREFDAACITSASDVRELIGFDADPPREPTHAPQSTGARDAGPDARPPTDDTTRVRDALSMRVAREAIDLARRSGMSVDAIEAVLGLLQLEGSVVRTPHGWRMTTTPG